jgi:D-sedoheptulose 7-phosphate isomerase
MSFTNQFLRKATELLQNINQNEVESVIDVLVKVRKTGGRLFLLGSGGGAGHASHAACDFRKLCDIEAYAPYDNVSELTARVNDEGWDVTLSNWLKVSRFNAKDCLFIFSVGGGSETAQISMNLVNAIKYAKQLGANVVGIVGRDGGYTKTIGNAVVVLPVVQGDLVTPLTEGFQSLIWHLIVSHPKLQINIAKWESADPIAIPTNSIEVALT